MTGGVALVDVLAGPRVGSLPVLSPGPALAAISSRPLATALIGALALACGVILAVYDDLDASRLGVIALGTIAGVTAAGVIASAGRRRRERELADFKAIADAAQQILLRPVPRTIPPADIAVRYVSAAASARIGGDLYEAVSSGGGVRLIVGDVLGKGLAAARTAAVVLGAFRESAYDAARLAEIAARIEASLQHHPLERSGTLLGLPDLGSALDELIEDVLRHVGHTLQDDAAILGAVHTYTLGFAALEASRARQAPGSEDVSGLIRQLAAYTTTGQFTEGLRYLLEGISGHVGTRQ